MKEETKQKRLELATLSNNLKNLAKFEGFDYETVNELIMKFAYNPDQTKDFKSFMGWKMEGFSVKKGEKAFLLWGKPIEQNKTKEVEQTGEIDEYSFFPLAYIFSNEQVEPIKTK